MKRLATILTLGAALMLAGCAGGGREGDRSPLIAAGNSLFSTLKARTGPQAAPKPPVKVTRALLDQTPGEVLQAVPESTGLPDFLRLVGRRADGTPGRVEVWESSDGKQVILREGVLVGTKGLGGDMRSAEARAVIAGFDGQGGGGERLITLARLDGTAQVVPFSCDVTQLGREVIQIVDRQVATYRLREDCRFGDHGFSNDYWVETDSGRMRRSRQWAGPNYGYVDLTRLKD